MTRNARGSGHLGFANGAWPPDRSAATKIYGTARWWRPRPGRLHRPFGQPGRLQEFPESHVDGLQGPIWTAWRLQRATWTAREAAMGGPGGSSKLFGLLGRLKRPPFGEPGRLQMEYESYWAAREAAESHLDCPGNCRDRLGQPRRQQKGFRPLKPLHRASVREATEGFRPPKPWLRASRQKWGLG